MKQLKYMLVLMIMIAACKTQKTIVENTEVKKISSRKIVKKHAENIFSANTLDSKIKVRYTNYRSDKRKRYEFTVRMRIKKDSLIWMKGTKVVTAFKIKITPNSFSYYSPLSKEYFEGDFSLLEKMLGIKVSFTQLQDLLMGKSIFEMKGKRFDSEIAEKSYKLTPKIQEKLFDVFFKINPNHFKLDQMYMLNEEKDQSLRIDYEAYSEIEENHIPIKMTINAIEGEQYTWISMQYRSLTLNKPIKVHYKIPSGYKRIDL